MHLLISGDARIICNGRMRWQLVRISRFIDIHQALAIKTSFAARAINNWIFVFLSTSSNYFLQLLPIVTQHYTMLQRNLLYTAITRARKLCVLAGIPRAISMAVRNNKVAQRFTALEWRLAK
jgi:hypothetical protein